MTTTPRSLMWPILIITVGGVWLLMVAGAFPEAVGDLLVRAWPALVFLFAFDVVLGRRRLRVAKRRVDLGLVGVLVTVLMLAGIIWFAYQNQADVLRTDRTESLTQTLPEGVDHVRVELAVERTAVTVNPSEGDGRALNADFRGSRESDVTIGWSIEGDTAVLSITEAYTNSIPKLKDYGRGALSVTLPADAVIDVLVLHGSRGDVLVDSRLLRIEQVDVVVGSGNLTLYLPTLDVLQGDLRTGDGGVNLFVPAGMALILKTQGGEPEYSYDTFRYDLLRDGTLKYKSGEPYQFSLDVWLKKGAPLVVTDLES